MSGSRLITAAVLAVLAAAFTATSAQAGPPNLPPQSGLKWYVVVYSGGKQSTAGPFASEGLARQSPQYRLATQQISQWYAAVNSSRGRAPSIPGMPNFPPIPPLGVQVISK